MIEKDIVSRLAEKAAQSHLFLIGELHGTREVRQLVLDLLDALWARGYRALALELPASDRAALLDFALGRSLHLPPSVGRPMPDGRASAELVGLIRAAASRRPTPQFANVIASCVKKWTGGAPVNRTEEGRALPELPADCRTRLTERLATGVRPSPRCER